MKESFVRTAASITAAVIATMLAIAVDGIITGRFLGEDCMAAYGLATPIINLTTIFSGVLSSGAQVMCSYHIGAGHPEHARKTFSVSMVATAAISILLVSTVLIFRMNIATFLGAFGESAHLLSDTADYLLGMAFSLPVMIFLFEFNVLLRLDNDARLVSIGVLVMSALHLRVHVAAQVAERMSHLVDVGQIEPRNAPERYETHYERQNGASDDTD